MDFPVDVVYTWVDGKDPLWLAERACFLKKENINYNKRGLIPEPVGASLMSFSETELYYSIQSVKKYMSWVRKIYVVTPGHKPKESEKFQDIIFINQEDIIPKTVRTPIFNSNGIELCIHKIDGLAEHFIYFNDDFFVNRPIIIENFFYNNRTSLFHEKFGGFLRLTPDFVMSSYLHRGVTTQQRQYTNNLLNQRFGISKRFLLQHSPVFIIKKHYQKMLDNFSWEAKQTLSHRFRHPKDLVTPHFLYPYYLLFHY